MSEEVALSKEEFVNIREEEQGIKTTQPSDVDKHKRQDAVDAMSTRAFLIGRTNETIQVHVSGLGGSKNIEIRARLSKAEMKQHESLLDRWNAAQTNQDIKFIETIEDEVELAVFLAHITIDTGLSSDFWLSDELAPEIADDILMAYFIEEPLRRMTEISRFLGERLRARIQPDVASVASDTKSVR